MLRLQHVKKDNPLSWLSTVLVLQQKKEGGKIGKRVMTEQATPVTNHVIIKEEIKPKFGWHSEKIPPSHHLPLQNSLSLFLSPYASVNACVCVSNWTFKPPWHMLLVKHARTRIQNVVP